jgi:hypothetical protein
MGKLLSCPFCRELFSEDEGKKCPECGLPLVSLASLPLSLEGRQEAQDRGDLDAPFDQRLPFFFIGRGRALLFLLAGLGLGLFFAPWASLERPEVIDLTGFDLARSGAPWLWGGAVGWFTMIPLLLSRRSVNQLRGIRVIASFFCMATVGEVALMLLNPPNDHLFFSSGLQYSWGIYASGAAALLGTSVALRLGGSTADLRDLPVTLNPIAERGKGPLH